MTRGACRCSPMPATCSPTSPGSGSRSSRSSSPLARRPEDAPTVGITRGLGGRRECGAPLRRGDLGARRGLAKVLRPSPGAQRSHADGRDRRSGRQRGLREAPAGRSARQPQHEGRVPGGARRPPGVGRRDRGRAGDRRHGQRGWPTRSPHRDRPADPATDLAPAPRGRRCAPWKQRPRTSIWIRSAGTSWR